MFYLISGSGQERIHSGGDTTFNRLVGQEHKYEGSSAASAALEPAQISSGGGTADLRIKFILLTNYRS